MSYGIGWAFMAYAYTIHSSYLSPHVLITDCHSGSVPLCRSREASDGPSWPVGRIELSDVLVLIKGCHSGCKLLCRTASDGHSWPRARCSGRTAGWCRRIGSPAPAKRLFPVNYSLDDAQVNLPQLRPHTLASLDALGAWIPTGGASLHHEKSCLGRRHDAPVVRPAGVVELVGLRLQPG